MISSDFGFRLIFTFIDIRGYSLVFGLLKVVIGDGLEGRACVYSIVLWWEFF